MINEMFRSHKQERRTKRWRLEKCEVSGFLVRRWRRHQLKKATCHHSYEQDTVNMVQKSSEAEKENQIIQNIGQIGTDSTGRVPSSVERRLDAYHRRQLRRVLGIKFPKRISKNQLYEKTGEERNQYKVSREKLGRNQLAISWDEIEIAPLLKLSGDISC